jgi:hypothetical protein
MGPTAEDRVVKQVRRAPRYDLQAPVRYRLGAGTWQTGTTLNASRLGMLIRTSAPVPPLSSVLQLQMALSADRGWAGAYVACTVRVVRLAASAVEGETLMAVAIADFQLRPPGWAEDEGLAPSAWRGVAGPGDLWRSED